MIRLILISLLPLFAACNNSAVSGDSTAADTLDTKRDLETGEVFHALRHSVSDQRDMKFRTDQGYTISFGRGSGWFGLETIEVDLNLNAKIYRQTESGWKTCSISLTNDEWRKITDSIERHQLYKLDREYHADVADGTQWILWIVQNGRSKLVYCNNFFPDNLRTFAHDIDSVFNIHDDLLGWETVPANLERKHDDLLWDSKNGR